MGQGSESVPGYDEGDPNEDRKYWGGKYSNVTSKKLEYGFNTNAKIGNKMSCPSCKRELIKKSYQHKFCSTKCKDDYWNLMRN